MKIGIKEIFYLGIGTVSGGLTLCNDQVGAVDSARREHPGDDLILDTELYLLIGKIVEKLRLAHSLSGIRRRIESGSCSHEIFRHRELIILTDPGALTNPYGKRMLRRIEYRLFY